MNTKTYCFQLYPQGSDQGYPPLGYVEADRAEIFLVGDDDQRELVFYRGEMEVGRINHAWIVGWWIQRESEL